MLCNDDFGALARKQKHINVHGTCTILSCLCFMVGVIMYKCLKYSMCLDNYNKMYVGMNSIYNKVRIYISAWFRVSIRLAG